LILAFGLLAPVIFSRRSSQYGRRSSVNPMAAASTAMNVSSAPLTKDPRNLHNRQWQFAAIKILSIYHGD
jgi:hypothetical protein